MSFLTPLIGAIAAAVVIPSLVALYFLKLRRKRVEVPSTLLWKKTIQDMQVNSPFQKLRRSLLLLLQLLILAALLFAVARPTMFREAEPGQRSVILIDHSGSMSATDGPGGGTRLDEAKALADQVVDALGADGAGQAMVVSFAEAARVVQPMTGDVGRLRAAIASIGETDQRGRIGEALRLLEPFAQEVSDGGAGDGALVVHVITDGRVHRLATDDQAALPGADVRFVRVIDEDAAVDNVGVVGFSARRDFDKPQIVQAFGRLVNYGPEAVQTTVELRLDGQLLRVEPVELAGATVEGPAERSLQFDFVNPESALLELAVTRDDALASDDIVRTVLAPARQLRVLLVTSGNGFLQRVIEGVGVRELVVWGPEKYADQDPEALGRGGWDDGGVTADEGFDAIVFDRVTPTEVPAVDSVYFGAAPPLEGLAIRGEDDDRPQVMLNWERDDPLMRYVALDDVVVATRSRVETPEDGEVLATATAGPTIVRVTRGGVRHVVVGFGVVASNWPLQVSFPVFVSNAVQTLGLGGLADAAGVSFRAGEVAVVPLDAGGEAAVYRGPVTLAARPSEGLAVVPRLERVGLYEAQSEVEAPFDRLAVNLLDALESDLRPTAALTVGTTESAAVAGGEAVRREVWWWFVLAALVVLGVEWL
ncbi:MAG: VWA domain-containing protein, partial [Planctomycetota bacterium]